MRVDISLRAALFTHACVKRGAILIIVLSNGIRFEKIAGNCSCSRSQVKASMLHSRRIFGTFNGCHAEDRHDNAFVDAFRETVQKSEHVSIERVVGPVEAASTMRFEGVKLTL